MFKYIPNYLMGGIGISVTSRVLEEGACSPSWPDGLVIIIIVITIIITPDGGHLLRMNEWMND
jgi:branched-subunit amino acid ABC-type transport system permease component